MKHATDDRLVICISPGMHGRWDVSGKGSEWPLATFAECDEACAYATELAMQAGEATVMIEEREGFSPILVNDLPRRAAPAGPEA